MRLNGDLSGRGGTTIISQTQNQLLLAVGNPAAPDDGRTQSVANALFQCIVDIPAMLMSPYCISGVEPDGNVVRGDVKVTLRKRASLLGRLLQANPWNNSLP